MSIHLSSHPSTHTHLPPTNLPTGQIGNNDSANDIRDVDLTRIHYLTGPFEIESAEPGDVLLVEIQDVQPLQEQPWGFTGIFAKENGGGFLDGIYPEPWVDFPVLLLFFLFLLPV